MSKTKKGHMVCGSCGSKLRLNNFYTVNSKSDKDFSKEDLVKDGRLDMCKKCLRNHYSYDDTDQADRFFRIMDYPFSENMWEYFIKKKLDKGYKLTFPGVFGSVVSTLAFKDATYYDYQEIEEFYEMKLKTRMKDLRENSKTKALRAREKKLKERERQKVQKAIMEKTRELETEMFLEEKKKFVVEVDDLTEDDKRYLKGKWGEKYDYKELIKMERGFLELMKHGDPEDSVQNDYAKKISKISYLMDKALDEGNSRNWKEYGNLYHKLMKEADFSNQGEQSEAVNSISELAAMCESVGFIQTDDDLSFDQDKVDLTIDTMQQYTKDLVTEETGLTKIIRNTLEEMVYNNMISAEELIDIADFENKDEFKDEIAELLKEED